MINQYKNVDSWNFKIILLAILSNELFDYNMWTPITEYRRGNWGAKILVILYNLPPSSSSPTPHPLHFPSLCFDPFIFFSPYYEGNLITTPPPCSNYEVKYIYNPLFLCPCASPFPFNIPPISFFPYLGVFRT